MKSLQTILPLLVAFCFSNLAAGADVIKFKGDNYTIKCAAPGEDANGVYLYSRREHKRKIIYYCFNTQQITFHDNKGRVEVRNDDRSLTIDMLNLQLTDTGAYFCSCTSSLDCEMEESGVFLLVHEPEIITSPSTSASKSINDLMIPVVALTAGSVLLLLLLVLGVWLVPKMKKMTRSIPEEERRSANGVYEVMTVHRKTQCI